MTVNQSLGNLDWFWLAWPVSWAAMFGAIALYFRFTERYQSKPKE